MIVLNSLKRHQNTLLAFGFFCLMTFLALDNLILHMGTAVPVPDFPYKDYAMTYWNLWWVKHAVLDLHTNPFFTNYTVFPNTVNLALHSLFLPLGLVSAPFQLFLDMHWIVNGLVVLSFLLSSVFMFVFLRRHVHNTWLAVLGATIYAFAPGPLWRAAQLHLNTLPIWWLPLNLILWDLAVERRSAGWAAALGLCIYTAYLNHYESILWILLTLSPYMLYGLFTQNDWPARRQVIRLGLVAAVAAAFPTLIAPLPQLAQVGWDQYTRVELQHVQEFAMPITGLFMRQEVPEHSTLGQTLPVLVLVGLALTGKRRQRWLWLGIGLVGLVLSLGLYLDDPSKPLPFMLLYNLFQGQIRTPIRFTAPASLALVIFVVYSLANLVDRLQSQRILGVMVAGIIAIYCVDIDILAPFPVLTIRDYPVYRVIGADPEDHTLLQAPYGVGVGTGRWIGHNEQLAFYAPLHHQRAISGGISRLPDAQLDRLWRSNLLRAFALEGAFPPVETVRDELARKLKTWDIRYIVVHRDLLAEDQARWFAQLLNLQPGLCLFYTDADTLAYRAVAAWSECPRPDLIAPPPGGKLDLGEPGDDRFIGPGWYDAENVGGPQARWAGEGLTSTLRLLLPSNSIHIRFRAAAFPPNQSVAILVNGQPVKRLELKQDWAEYDLDLSEDARRGQGPSIITLAHSLVESDFDRTGGASPDKRLLSAAYDYFEFEVK